MPLTRIDLVRHGQPEGGNRFRGHGVDDPLSSLGWQQMRATAAMVDDWQQVISSPMQRCIAFARWLSNERGLPLELVPDLREIGFGSWEGVSRSELREQRRDEYEAFYQDPVHNRPAGAEPLDDFGHRVARALDAAATQHAGERVLIVAHAGVIRAAIGHVLQSPPALWYQCDVANAGLTRLVRDNEAWRLVRHNWLPTMED
jgi:alpha-ribazole phosphatase